MSWGDFRFNGIRFSLFFDYRHNKTRLSDGRHDKHEGTFGFRRGFSK